ncbi:MAG: hypothetical protein JNM80_11835 [Phycisphaerae bacterium]|nr:hypothetical protein [Phycisphaerae bacterium]
MTLSRLLEHWRLTENPFRGEEARHDSVFARIGTGLGARTHAAFHSDFEKVLGDLSHPAAAIVFGEKGSGKTAMRLQIEDRIARHNAAYPDRRVLLFPYDDLNGVLERFHRRVGSKTPLESFQKFRTADHLDALLLGIVPTVVDALLDRHAGGPTEFQPGPEPRKRARQLDEAGKRDLLMLQVAYDRPDGADVRTRRLRRMLRVPLPTRERLWVTMAWVGWLPAAALAAWVYLWHGPGTNDVVWRWAVLATAGLWALIMAKRLAWDRLGARRAAIRMRRQIRVSTRSDASYARSLRQIDDSEWGQMPLTDSDEPRYAMLARLRRALAHFGHVGVVVVMDRVDEPTLVSGDPDRMRAIVWPLLNNKLLQQEGFGLKLLLPMELRHALFKESSAFFQEARLDKQSLIERLNWTGSTLFDLCDARVRACVAPDAPPIGLLDLFAEDVTARDVVDALEQMHQPRDALKFVYQCLSEHCAGVTEEQGQWRVTKATLDQVRRQQAERVQQLYRGIRPG